MATQFKVNKLIAGMTEALQLMSVGDRYLFWIPQDLAYGENPRAGAPKGMLVFDVELISIDESTP
ncbi:FKBP-type peptidyl-prolyl cis-trans isomerase [Alteromonas facilis]|uniref:FKBP-type peptidyl-prolyl cis-trans isomerase n=1 Tax=Alteromonas facilis TaxID=2048004 RepID=UPI000C2884FA|nr:FKBP-type peptidyl-prolyl cis-trans isomerase [Alteromonas facilis]